MAKVMLVEDDKTMLSLLKTLLKLEGHASVEVGEHDDIVQMIHREKPDVVLMDVHLPQGNGVDILRQIRSDAALDKTVIIMQSGMDLEVECEEAGADIFLMKPYMPDTLMQAIFNGLASRSA